MHFDYEKHIWGAGSAVMRLKDRRNSSLGLRRFLKAITDRSGRMLEIGCGAGAFLRSVKHYRQDLKVCGCDVSQAAISIAEKNRDYSIEYRVADAASLPYEDASFDIIAMMDVIEHLEDITKALTEAKRVLKKGGLLYILVPCEANKFTLHWLMWKLKLGHNLKKEYSGHIQRLTRNQIHNFVNQQNLVIISETFSFHPLGQIYDIFFDYLPRKFMKDNKDDSPKANLSINDKIRISIRQRGVFLTLCLILGRLFDMAAFYESQIFKNLPLAIGVHISCIKED